MFVNWKMLETQNAASWTKLSVIPDAEGRQSMVNTVNYLHMQPFLRSLKLSCVEMYPRQCDRVLKLTLIIILRASSSETLLCKSFEGRQAFKHK